MSLLLLFKGGGGGGTAQVATATFTGVAGTISTGGVTVTAQVALGTFAGVAGTRTPGGVSVTAQVATGTFAGVAGTTTLAVTQTAQVATSTFSGVAGTVSTGNASRTAQVATGTFSGVAGTPTPGAATQTAQVATGTFSGVAGTQSVGMNAQVATATFSGVPGTVSTGGVSVTAQIATATFSGVAGTKTGVVTQTAQVGTGAFSGIAGTPTAARSLTAQVATATFKGSNWHTNALRLPGLVNSYASVPDSTAVDLTDDIEFILRLAPEFWTFNTPGYVLLAKPFSGTTNFYLSLTPTGPVMGYSLAVSPTTLQVAFVNWDRSAIPDGTPLWVRWSRVSSTGTCTLEYAADQTAVPTSWTTVGNSGPRPSGALSNTTSVLGIGGNSSVSNMSGEFYRAIIKHNGTTVLDADFTTVAAGAASFAESASGQIVTIAGSSRITARVNTAVTVTAQVATATFSGVAGTKTGAVTTTGQIATGTFSGVSGTSTTAVTRTAQVATATFTGIPGSPSAIGSDTVTAQVATVTFTGVPGTISTGGVSVIAQVATATFVGVAGTRVPGGVSKANQVATATFVGATAMHGNALRTYQGADVLVFNQASIANIPAIDALRDDFELVGKLQVDSRFRKPQGPGINWIGLKVGAVARSMISPFPSLWINDGTTASQVTSSVSLPANYTDGTTPFWFKVTHTGGVAKFWTAPATTAPGEAEPTGVGWTQLGTSIPFVKTISSGSNGFPHYIMGYSNGFAENGGGQVYRTIVRDNVDGTVLFDIDFSKQKPGTTSFVEAVSGKTVTVGSDASITMNPITAVTVTAQVATATFSGVAGTASSAFTRTAQTATASFTGVAGSKTTAKTQAAQTATATFTGVPGSSVTGSVSRAAQVATATFTGVAGAKTAAVSVPAQSASSVFVGVPGVPVLGGVTVVGQSAEAAFAAISGVSVAHLLYQGSPALAAFEAVPGTAAVALYRMKWHNGTEWVRVPTKEYSSGSWVITERPKAHDPDLTDWISVNA